VILEIVDDYRCTTPTEFNGNRFTDTARAARNQCDFAGQIVV
jgi:hypothetical protein